MPRIRVDKKEVPDWEYPEGIHEIMMEFEELVEKIRQDAAKSGRNLVAGRRARSSLQDLRNDLGPRLRKAMLDESNRLEALRHGMTPDEWKRHNNRGD